MPQIVVPTFKGLYVQANSFSAVPDGALEIAENVVVTHDGRIQKRRGIGALSTVLTTPTGLIDFLGYLFICYNAKIALINDTTGALTDLTGAVTINSGSKPRFAKAGGNLFIASATGLRKVESSTATVLAAGIPSGLDLTIGLTLTSGVLAPNAQVGYRILFGRKDANNNKVVGAPSELTSKGNAWLATGRSAAAGGAGSLTVTVTSVAHGLLGSETLVVGAADGTNTNGTWTVTYINVDSFSFLVTTAPVGLSLLSYGVYKTPTITFTLPSELTTEAFYQVYRTIQTTSSSTAPDDDAQLIYEANVSSTNVSNGYVTFVDTIDEIFKLAALYTNPNQGGSLSANNRPPFAADICLFRDCLFAFNIQYPFFLALNLISVRTGAFAAADYVVITSGANVRRYIATASLPASEGGSAAATPNTSVAWDYGGLDVSGHAYFYLSNSTTTSVSVPIATTAKSLGKAINRRTLSEVTAKYVSGAQDVPGQLYLESKTLTPTFSVIVSGATMGACWQPTLPTSGVTVAAANSSQANGLAFSKAGQHEAFPTPQVAPVGAKTGTGLRCVPLRDSVILITDSGVWKCTGDSPSNFQVTLLDSTVICVAADTVCVLNNTVFFLSNQGVVAVNENGADVVSRDIEALMTAINGQSYIAAQSNAVAYESERQFLLSTVSPNETEADVTYIYNAVTQAWTTSTRVFSDAIINPANDKLYVIDELLRVARERKSQNKLDYTEEADDGTAGPVTGADEDTCELVFPDLTPAVGDIIVEAGSDTINRIESIDTSFSPTRYTFAAPLSFIEGASISLYQGFRSLVRTAPLTAGDASRWKQFWQFDLLFRNRSATELTLRFYTDGVGGTTDQSWTARVVTIGWGYGWGSNWGGDTIESTYITEPAQPLVTLIPKEASRATWIQAEWEHDKPGESMEIQGFAYSARSYGERISR